MTEAPSPDRQSLGPQVQEQQERIDKLDKKLDSKVNLEKLSAEQKEKLKETYIDKVNTLQSTIGRAYQKIDVQKDLRTPDWRNREKQVLQVEKGLFQLLRTSAEQLQSENTEGNAMDSALASVNLQMDEFLSSLRASEMPLKSAETPEAEQKQPVHIPIEKIFAIWKIPGTEAEVAQKAKSTREYYGEETIQHLEVNLSLFEALPSSVKEKIGGPQQNVDRQQIAGQLANNTFQSSDVSFLLMNPQELEAQVGKAQEEVKDEASKVSEEIQDLQQKSEAWIREVCSAAKADVADETIGNIVTWIMEQNGYPEIQKQIITHVRDITGQIMILEAKQGRLSQEIRQTNYAFHQLDIAKAKNAGNSAEVAQLFFRSAMDFGQKDAVSQGYLALLRPAQRDLVNGNAELALSMSIATFNDFTQSNPDLDVLDRTDVLRLTRADLRERQSATFQVVDQVVKDPLGWFSPKTGSTTRLQIATSNPFESQTSSKITVVKELGQLQEGGELILVELPRPLAQTPETMVALRDTQGIIRLQDGTVLENPREHQPMEISASVGTQIVYVSLETATFLRAKTETTSASRVVLRSAPQQTDALPFRTLDTSQVQLATMGENGTLELSDANGRTEQVIEAEALLKKSAEEGGDVLRSIDSNSVVKSITRKAGSLQGNMKNMQTMLHTAMSEEATVGDDFVGQMRNFARPMLQMLEDPATRTEVLEAKQLLESHLSQINSGHFIGRGIESDIRDHIDALNGYLKILDNDRLKNTLQTAMEVRPETWAAWATKDGIIMLGSIVVATAAIVALTLATEGVGLIAVSAAGAGAGIAGAEGTKELLYRYHHNIGGAGEGEYRYSDASRLGNYFRGSQLFDAESGEFVEMGFLKDVTLPYAQEFCVSFATTALALGAGQKAAAFLSRLSQNSSAAQALAKNSIIANAVMKKMSHLSEAVKNPTLGPASKSFGKETFREILDEVQDEMLEAGVAQGLMHFDERLAGLATFLVCTGKGFRPLRGNRVAYPSTMNVAEVRKTMEEQGHTIMSVSYDGIFDIKTYSGETVILQPDLRIMTSNISHESQSSGQIVEIEEKNGEPKRVWVESQVSPDGMSAIVVLQRQVKEVIPELELNDLGKVHLTLLHIGKPNDLYKDVQHANPACTYEQFRVELNTLLVELESAMNRTELHAEGVELFDMGAVVLKLRASDMKETVQRVNTLKNTFLNRLGIAEADAFCRGSENLKFSLPESFNPHITLGFIQPGQSTSGIEGIDVSGLKVIAEPSTIANVTIKRTPESSQAEGPKQIPEPRRIGEYGKGEGPERYTHIVPLTEQIVTELALPEKLSLPEGIFLRKEEFHATTIGFSQAEIVERKIAEAGEGGEALKAKVGQILSEADFSYSIVPGTLRMVHNKEYNAEAVRAGGTTSEYSIIVDIDMPGMKVVYTQLRSLGIELGEPNPHITLFIKDNGDATGLGIGVNASKFERGAMEMRSLNENVLRGSESAEAGSETPVCRLRTITPKIQRTIERAAEFHAGQTRKGGDTPYIVHPYGVAEIVEKMGGNEALVCAALLHDVLEDVPGTSHEALVREFGKDVADYVKELSEDKDPSVKSNEKATWKDRKLKYLEHTKVESEGALTIAVADKLYNLRNFVTDLELKGQEVLKNFNAPLTDIIWFNRSFIEIAESRLSGDAVVAELRNGYRKLESLAINLGFKLGEVEARAESFDRLRLNESTETILGQLTKQFDTFAEYYDILNATREEIKAVLKEISSREGLSAEEGGIAKSLAEGTVRTKQEERLRNLEEKLGKKREQFEEDMRAVEMERNHLLQEYFQKIEPNIEIVNVEKGIFKIRGEEIYGSLTSLIDTNASIQELTYLAEAVAIIEEPGVVESRTVISGSSAQAKVNKSPADYDLSENVVIHVNQRAEMGTVVTRLVSACIARTSKNPTLEFTEMKLGKYPKGTAPIEGKSVDGKPMKWKQVDLMNKDANGIYKVINMADGSTQKAYLQDAASDPGTVKIDWRGVEQAGEITEITKVINLQVKTPDGNVIFTNVMKDNLFQEVYFANPEVMELLQYSTSPEVVYSWRSFNKRDIVKYAKEGNYLKVAKRMWSLLKSEGKFGTAVRLEKVLSSEFGKLNQIQDRLEMLSSALKEGTKFSKITVLNQLDAARSSLMQSGNIQGKEDFLGSIKEIRQQVDSLEPQEGQLRSEAVSESLAVLSKEMKKEVLRGSTELFESDPEVMNVFHEIREQYNNYH